MVSAYLQNVYKNRVSCEEKPRNCPTHKQPTRKVTKVYLILFIRIVKSVLLSEKSFTLHDNKIGEMEWHVHFWNLLWNSYVIGNINWYVGSVTYYQLNTSDFPLHEEEKYTMCGMCFRRVNFKQTNSMVWVRERTIPTERPPLVGEVIANFCG
jgi:hypothetical protein